MYLTQETDYAMRIVFCLAKAERRMDAASISTEMCVSLRFALKIMGKLAGAGLINSYKGIKGGYELACPPDQITLRQVMEAVEGRGYAFSRCLCEGSDCNRGMAGCCVFQQLWQGITDEVNQQLESVTFAQMLEREKSRRGALSAGTI